jgi:hypothetical protein
MYYASSRWHPRARVVARCASGGTAAVAVVFVALFLAWLTGLLGPVENFVAERKLAMLERYLRVGESRTEIARHFGHEIPQPDRRSGYGASAAEGVPSWDAHLGEYAYEANGSFCYSGYEGIVVYYDVHDRVKSSKRFEFGDDC